MMYHLSRFGNTWPCGHGTCTCIAKRSNNDSSCITRQAIAKSVPLGAALNGRPQAPWPQQAVLEIRCGTVLMLRYEHRLSKDSDLFVPDSQHLGYVTPCLSDVAASITADYVEGSHYVKLFLPEGEIDIAPHLVRHREVFLHGLTANAIPLSRLFNDIRTLIYCRHYDECVEKAAKFLNNLPLPG